MTRALRILHVASGDLWAGAEVQAFTLMSHLSRMPATEVAAVLMNEGTLADKLRAGGISVHITDERELGAMQILSSLRRLLLSWQPDVIHTHREKENILGCLGNRTCRNVPAIRTVHGGKEQGAPMTWRSFRHRLVSRVDRWCGRMLQERIIAVTRELAGRLAKDFPAGKIAVIENGVDLESLVRERGVPGFRVAEPSAIHVGIAGRLVDVKRVDLFLEAAALLLRECPERRWRFHIFGDGPNGPDLQRLAARLQVDDKVIFHGHRRDIVTCVAGLDVLVISSDHEGMPMISLESVALAVPTVAHAVGGLVEVVPAEFLVSQHDARGYKAGVLRALGADARAIAASRGKEVATRFSAARNAERVRALYEEVLAARNRNNTKGNRAD